MDVPEIDIAELARVWAEGAVLIDVRETDEYTAAHVPGATLAVNGRSAGALPLLETPAMLFVEPA